MFGIQFNRVFGTFGQFDVRNGDSTLRAQYLLTKFRPGNDGAWENDTSVGTGKISGGAVFDGINDYIEVASAGITSGSSIVPA